MKRAAVLSILVAVVLLAVGVAVEAQQPTKVPRIGFLIGASASTNVARLDAFRQGMRALEYVEGKNIVIEYRYAEGKPDRLPAFAAELTIPIVMAIDDDPVGSGFAASLARPGGNITGLSGLAPEISGKQLELLREIVPKLSRLGILGDVTRPGIPQALREINLAADAVRVQIQFLEVREPKDIETAFRAAGEKRAEALLMLGSPVLISHRRELADLAVKSRLPAIYRNLEFVEDGGLMAYGASLSDSYRRAATYVDKILKGAKPADLPIEQPKKFELVINLKAAKQIGLTIPPNVLVRADKVIR